MFELDILSPKFPCGGITRMTTLITLLIGMFIGWNLPQPDWAHAIQDKVTKLLNSATKK